MLLNIYWLRVKNVLFIYLFILNALYFGFKFLVGAVTLLFGVIIANDDKDSESVTWKWDKKSSPYCLLK